MASDPRLRQLSRIYNRILETPEDARAAIAAGPGVLASALFLEAAASDDVTSVGSANDYLESRLAELSAFTGERANEVRRQFATMVSRWDETP
ncbi:MAG: hypothetical protein KJ048_16655 [Dehalococcoidia bacterium]|nr:hypothetical protein [Dehalococcoidia bacterium]